MADIQIHELTAMSRDPVAADVLAIDTGSLTLKIPFSALSGAIAEDAIDGIIADEYSPSGPYAVGKYCMYGGALYRCKETIATGEAWTAAHWQQVTLANDVSQRINALEQDWYANAVLVNAGGTMIAVDDSAKAPIDGIVIEGRTMQRGTPTFASPVAFENVTSVKSAGINILPKFTVQSLNGIDLSINADGSVLAEGTNTSASSFMFYSAYQWIGPGTYKVSGCPSGGGASSYRVAIRDRTYGTDLQLGKLPSDTTGFSDTTVSYETSRLDDGSGVVFTLTASHYVSVSIRFAENYEITGSLLFQPMLRLTAFSDDAYKAYNAEDYSLSAFENGVNGILVDGEWICDTVDLDAGTWTQRVYVEEPNSANIYTYVTSSETIEYRPTYQYDTVARSYKVISDCGIAVSAISQIVEGESFSVASASSIATFFIKVSGLSSKADAIAWFDEHPYTFAYVLQTPIVHQLTAAQVEQLKAISTKYLNTTLYNNMGGNINVRYVADMKTYLDSMILG